MMKVAVNPIPEDYHSVTPYLKVRDASGLIDFLRQAFDAEERDRMERPDGKIMHAEVRIGDSVVMLGDVAEGEAPMPTTLNLYVEDVDATYRRALAAGATSVREPADQFYGDRSGGVQDPFGNQWWISTHVEDVSPEEVRRRAEAQAVQQG
jgi:uncharacterized glyoxalase superfamily protein PhnB